jgi:phosphoglycerate kinase
MKPMIKYLSKTNRKALAGVALLRLDFNTKDNWRMDAVLPTVKLLAKTAAKVVIVSHRGRPEGGEIVNGMPKGFPADLHLKRDAVHLARLIKRPIKFVSHFRFDEIKQKITRSPKGSIFMLDNLRFLKGEEVNDPALAQQLASLADFYVNDAFAVDHRANASVVAITKFLPSYAGIELEAEIAALSKAIVNPERPLVLILGGAKASDKLGVISFFRRKADWFLLAGASANSILELKGVDVKRSLREKDPKTLTSLAEIARQKNVIVPVDFVWGHGAIFDIGPKTIALFAAKIAAARTIIWSGPIGLIEKKAYAKGSVAIAKAIGRNRRAFSVSGGGETVMFLKKYKLDKKFSFISTGGGAMVDFLAGEKLPGIEALK